LQRGGQQGKKRGDALEVAGDAPDDVADWTVKFALLVIRAKSRNGRFK
jgi:hypothetical protein